MLNYVFFFTNHVWLNQVLIYSVQDWLWPSWTFFFQSWSVAFVLLKKGKKFGPDQPLSTTLIESKYFSHSTWILHLEWDPNFVCSSNLRNHLSWSSTLWHQWWCWRTLLCTLEEVDLEWELGDWNFEELKQYFLIKMPVNHITQWLHKGSLEVLAQILEI